MTNHAGALTYIALLSRKNGIEDYIGTNLVYGNNKISKYDCVIVMSTVFAIKVDESLRILYMFTSSYYE